MPDNFDEEAHPRDEAGKFTEGNSHPADQTSHAGAQELARRSLDTMSEAIALSSPSGSMSKRARAAADARLSEKLFGPGGMKPPGLPAQPSEKERDLRTAAELRALAARGMGPRKNLKEAQRLESKHR